MNDEALVATARHLTRSCFSVFAAEAFAVVEGKQLYDNWLFYHLCYFLEEVALGRITRLIINVQPRSLKSFLASVALPAWILGRADRIQFMCVSHSEPLARHFGSQTRRLMQSDWYRRVFPRTELASMRPRDADLRTTGNGGRFAVGIGGAVTGRGGDIMVCDDVIKAQDALSEAARWRVNDFADTALWSRLNDRRRGAIIVVMQRFHEDDLTGHLIRRGGWTVVSIPAIAIENTVHRLSNALGHVHHRRTGDLLQPEREGPEQIEEQRRALGMYNFAAQYQQDPISAIGQVVLREWLRFYDTAPEHFDRIVVSWDTASTTNERSDFSACTVWGRVGENFYLIEVVRVRLQVPDLQQLMVEVSNDYPEHVFIVEDDGVGRGLVQNIRDRRLTRCRPRLNRPCTDKYAPFARHLPLIEEGRLFLPQEAEWCAAYQAELLAFPDSRHDDQIDATSQALDYLTQDAARSNPTSRRDVHRRDPVRRTIAGP